MAPKSSTKRTAKSAPVEEPPAKRLQVALKKHGVTMATYKQIAEAITHPLAEGFAEDCRDMMLAMLPQSLCVPSDERQEYQDTAVTMIGEVMSKVMVALQAALDQENEKVHGVEASKAGLEEKLRAAEAALKAAQASTSEQDAELQAASEAVVLAQAHLAGSQEQQLQGDAGLLAAQADKDATAAAVAGEFAKLKVGEWEEVADAKGLFQALEPVMKKLAMEESLKTATQSTLVKKPAERGPFDSTVLAELEKCFAAKLQELEAALASGKPDSEARAAAVLGAQTALEAAEARQSAASAGLMAQKELQKEAAAQVKADKAACAAHKPEYKKATELRDAKQNDLQLFLDLNMSSFDTLKCRLSTRKQKEIAAEAAAAAAEIEAAAAAVVAVAAAEAEAAAAVVAAAAAEVEAAAAAAAEAEAAAAAVAEAEAAAAAEAVAATDAAAAVMPEAMETCEATDVGEQPAKIFEAVATEAPIFTAGA